MSKDEKNVEAAALPDEVRDAAVTGRDLFESEDEYFNFLYQKLDELGGLTADEKDNMMAYLFCINTLKDDSSEFFYDMKTDYRVTWKKMTGQEWKRLCE